MVGETQFSEQTRVHASTGRQAGGGLTFERHLAGGRSIPPVPGANVPHAVGNMQVVSRNGGHSPRLRADGRELLYASADGTIMAATFDPSTGLGVPDALLKAPSGFASRDATGYRSAAPWAVTSDGQRFLFAVPEEGGSLNQLTVVLN